MPPRLMLSVSVPGLMKLWDMKSWAAALPPRAANIAVNIKRAGRKVLDGIFIGGLGGGGGTQRPHRDRHLAAKNARRLSSVPCNSGQNAASLVYATSRGCSSRQLAPNHAHVEHHHSGETRIGVGDTLTSASTTDTSKVSVRKRGTPSTFPVHKSYRQWQRGHITRWPSS